MKTFATVGLAALVLGLCPALAAGNGGGPRATSGRLRVLLAVDPRATARLTGVTYTLGRGLRVSGRGFPTCSRLRLATSVQTCPRRSRVGSGRAVAVLAGERTRVHFDVGIFVVRAHRLALVLTAGRPSRFSAILPGVITGRRIRVVVPTPAQVPVPGLDVHLARLDLTLGRATVGRGRTRHNVVDVVGCRSRRHPVRVRPRFTPGPGRPSATSVAAISCRS